MSLFQKSVLKKYVNALDGDKLDAAWSIFKAHFHNATIQENIRKSKEEQYQGEFLIDLFVKVFGYVKNPRPDFNLTTELKNVKGAKKTDGAVLQDGSAIAVIELKGTKVADLNKIETQAFGYKNNQPECVYVITSNFEKLRFYIDNAVDYEEFNLFKLTKDQFDILWLCVSSDSLLRGIPKNIKDESLTQEDRITKQLYKDYSTFRNDIFQSIVNLNPDHDKLTLFKKTQKLLDRFLFIFFAEDRLLLPPNSIREIIRQWTTLRDDLDEYVPLYDRFKKYFGYLNTGHKGKKHDIFAYNGGLFAPDEILDNIKIDDTLLYNHSQKLSNYDFESEVSVNILGHIFEHSLNEIEEIQAEIEGIETDKGKSKRKKDGVFYTPKYITKYIVDNTIGKLCKEKKEELGIDEEEYEKDRKRRKVKILKALQAKLETYREWLLQLTICDPACGSGAFLNQALEFLIAEHKLIDELMTKLLGGELVLPNVENTILENNLFGVDINNESIEIAKLSLWLRTAKHGRKLTTLNDNIKCGNSLIDDPEVAGDKAFNWESEFPEVFIDGGFDIIIGNPPYGAYISKDEKKYYKNNYEVTEYNYDTYNFFFEKSITILKPNNLLGFITPNTFLVLENGRKLREYIFKKNTLIELFEVFNVFPDAVVEPINIIIKKQHSNRDLSFNVLLEDRETNQIKINRFQYLSIFENKNLIFNYRINEKERKISKRLKGNSKQIGSVVEIKAGVKPYENGKGKPPQTKEIVLNKPFNAYENKGNEWRRVIRGTQINRYLTKWDAEYIKYGSWLAAPRRAELFDNDKLFMRRTDDNLMASFDNSGMIGINSVHCIQIKKQESKTDLKYVLAILNSNLINWYFRSENFHMVDKPLAEVKIVFVERLPFIFSENQLSFVKKVNIIIDLNKRLYDSSQKFIKRVKDNLRVEKISKLMSAFFEFEFKVFIAELKKLKIRLSLSDQDEWEEYFTKYKAEINLLQLQIKQTDRELNQLIYELYGLTKEEIRIVEEAIT